ncbi:hypothetical protein F7731_23755 [Cytobacillus depressus]|uniref:Uncharacterized protein n=1 Tax=Cytobacillus depressus TaxID=1602942 RepID=A0A6L3V3F0_9BACI|nr:hypothetical protein [Cytobacillus depressus]KAB2328968.1 hypothetical protein F7731_23755 [Cytobacillus depressus]
MRTQTPADRCEELVKCFDRDTVNHTYALNFILGTLRVYLQQGKTLTPEKLEDVLESALRFSKIRK